MARCPSCLTRERVGSNPYCYDCQYGKMVIRKFVSQLLPVGTKVMNSSRTEHLTRQLKQRRNFVFSWCGPRHNGIGLMRSFSPLPPGEALDRRRRRDAARRRVGNRKFSDAMLRDMLALQSGRCFYCDDPIESIHYKHMNVDHVLPRSRGGDDSDANLCAACPVCNTAKGNRTAGEFAMLIRKLHRRIDKWLPATKQGRLKLVA